MARKKTNPALPHEVHSLIALGPETESVIVSHFRTGANQRIDDALVQPSFLAQLADAFKQARWEDREAAQVVRAYLDTSKSGKSIDNRALVQWVLAHPNRAEAVMDCLSVTPPEEISILRVLSSVGNQKLVFLASWRLAQTQVVLKTIIAPPALKKVILEREAQAHPLSMRHPNIIETHILRNRDGEAFLIERLLPKVLSDNWKSNGVQDAANLLCDIANALDYLHSQLGGVHGDVKPDNIGMDGDRFILLDFGIYRPADMFMADVTGTGSLRTRAPELLVDDRYGDPYKVDVWALGATVYNAFTGHYPLFRHGEKPPPPSEEGRRRDFESELRRRATEEYDSFVSYDAIPSPINEVLRSALNPNPGDRVTAGNLRMLVEDQLAAFIRNPSGTGKLSPSQELDQLERYFPFQAKEALHYMPEHKKDGLVQRLNVLKGMKGFTEAERNRVDNLLRLL